MKDNYRPLPDNLEIKESEMDIDAIKAIVNSDAPSEVQESVIIKILSEDEQFKTMETEGRRESKECGYINWGDAFSDEHIDWFRNGD